MNKHVLGGWIVADSPRGAWVPSGTRVMDHDQAMEFLVGCGPTTRKLLAAAVGPSRVQSVMLDLAAPAVWENEGGALYADKD